MASTTQQEPASPLLHLPDEIWLEILGHLDYLTLWQTRAISTKLRTESERLAVATLLPNISMALTYTLSSGTRHRWYDVRATITFAFSSVNKHNLDFALFGIARIHPTNFHDRALKKWLPMCSRGLSPALEWQVSDSATTYGMRLSKVVGAQDGALWCDWRELITAWCRMQAATEAKLALGSVV